MSWRLWCPTKGSLLGFLTSWLLGGVWALVLLVLSFQYGILLWQLGGAQDERLIFALSQFSQEDADVAMYRTSDVADARRLAGKLDIETYPWPHAVTALNVPVLYVSHVKGVLVRAAVMLHEEKSKPSSGEPRRVLVQMAAPWHERVPSVSQLMSSMLSLNWVLGLALGVSLVIGSGLLIAKRWLERTYQTLDRSLIEQGEWHGEPSELQVIIANTRQLHQTQKRWVDEQKRFLDNASHQLRTPMAVLRNQIQSALAGDVPITQVMPQMLETTQRATHLIEQLLSLSKVEQFKRAGELQQIDLNVVAKNAVMDLSPLIAAKRLDFSLEGGSVLVSADVLMLNELLKNLLTNAIHHTPKNGRLGINLRDSVVQRGLVIWDEGPGIDDELQDRLFQPFVASAGGTGLGLSICLQMAQVMGAHVGLFNRVKDGKTVGVDAVVSWG